MDQELIKKIIQVKVEIADKVIDFLPEKAAHEVRNLGKIILSGLDESIKENEEERKTKNVGVGLKNVEIE